MHPTDLVAYLLERRLIDGDFASATPLQISTLTTRYNNYLVTAGDEQRYFVKRSESRATAPFLAREAAVYDVLMGDNGGGPLGPFIPERVLYDADENTLVLRLVPDATDLLHSLELRDAFVDGHAADLGRFLGLLHSDRARAHAARERLPIPVPWVSTLPSPDYTTFTTFTAATCRIISIIQKRPELSDALRQLAATWQPQALVHFDMKWGNCLVPDEAADGVDEHAPARPITVIDWEFAGYGDPLWDVGSVVHSFVTTWLSSIPMSAQLEPDHHIDAARWPFSAFERPLATFFSAYGEFVSLDEHCLIDITRYAGARLIQSAYEWTQTFDDMQCATVCCLQVGENLLLHPEVGIGALLKLEA